MPWGKGQQQQQQHQQQQQQQQQFHYQQHEPDVQEPTDHVIVNELPVDMTEERLKDVFGAYGTIKWCKLRKDGAASNTSSALIELDSLEEATYMVTALDENVPAGLNTPVRVRYKPQSKSRGGKGYAKGAGAGQERSGPYGPSSKGDHGSSGPQAMGGPGAGSIQELTKGLISCGAVPGGKWQNDENTVFVSGLPSDTTSADVLKIFSPFGAIAANGACALLNEDGTAKGTGIVNFLDAHGAGTAVAMLNNFTTPSGTNLRLRLFTPKSKGESGKGSS